MILLAVSLSMFGMLRIYMPKTYENEMAAQITANTQTFAEQLAAALPSEWEPMLMQFCLANSTGATLFNENGEKIAGFSVFAYTESDGIITQNDSNTAVSYSATFTNGAKRYTVVAYANTEAVEQVTGIFAKVFPFVLIFIILVGALVAFFYSRFLAKPIVDISYVSKKMTALNMSWRCDVSRTDEIGELAANLNAMAVKLDAAMKALQRANEKLQADIDHERKQERRRRDFFSAISHELKTPVTILKGELEGMILGVGKFKDRDTYLQESYETTQSIEKLVGEIMTLAKLDMLSLTPQETKLSDLVEDCLHHYHVLVQERRMQINSHYEEEQTVHVDRGQMRTALSNIIGNAIKHSPEGSPVDICIAQKDGKMALSIENSGAHIDSAELNQIWEPFYRIDKSRSRGTGGSGLGLYIVKTILDLHGLLYQFENNDRGMIFQITF